MINSEFEVFMERNGVSLYCEKLEGRDRLLSPYDYEASFSGEIIPGDGRNYRLAGWGNSEEDAIFNLSCNLLGKIISTDSGTELFIPQDSAGPEAFGVYVQRRIASVELDLEKLVSEINVGPINGKTGLSLLSSLGSALQNVREAGTQSLEKHKTVNSM